MNYGVDKLGVDAHTHRQTDAGNDNTRRPKLASGKKLLRALSVHAKCKWPDGPMITLNRMRFVFTYWFGTFSSANTFKTQPLLKCILFRYIAIRFIINFEKQYKRPPLTYSESHPCESRYALTSFMTSVLVVVVGNGVVAMINTFVYNFQGRGSKVRHK